MIFNYEDAKDDDGNPTKKRIPKAGKVYDFESDPAEHIRHQGQPNDELAGKIEAAINEKKDAAFLVRFMDSEGVAFDKFEGKNWVYENNQLSARTPEEATKEWMTDITKTMKQLPNVEGVNIVPAETFQLSKKTIEEGGGAAFAKAHHACTHKDQDGEYRKNLQHFFCKVGDDEFSHIINKLDCVDTNNSHAHKQDPRKDPVLIGGLTYSAAYKANEAFMENQDSGQSQGPVPAPADNNDHQDNDNQNQNETETEMATEAETEEETPFNGPGM